MSPQQLIDLRSRLLRKLSASSNVRCTGRLDSLTLALRQVERELAGKTAH